jgi:hypothetical protein
MAGGCFEETILTLVHKILLGAAAVVVASAASFPTEIGDLYRGTYPHDIRKSEALRICQTSNPSFVRFLASDREECYARLRDVAMPGIYSGMWSKHDHSSAARLAQD